MDSFKRNLYDLSMGEGNAHRFFENNSPPDSEADDINDYVHRDKNQEFEGFIPKKPEWWETKVNDYST